MWSNNGFSAILLQNKIRLKSPSISILIAHFTIFGSLQLNIAKESCYNIRYTQAISFFVLNWDSRVIQYLVLMGMFWIQDGYLDKFYKIKDEKNMKYLSSFFFLILSNSVYQTY